MKRCVQADGLLQPNWWWEWTPEHRAREKRERKNGRDKKRGGYNGHYHSYAKSASGYEPQQDYTVDPVWNNFTKRWERVDAENDANYVPGASSWERNNNQWPGHADDPFPMVEAGDMVLPDCVIQRLKDTLMFPMYVARDPMYVARDDVPDVRSPPSRTFTHQDVTPGVQSPSSGDITPPLPEQEAGDQPSPKHLWTLAGDDDSGDLHSMD